MKTTKDKDLLNQLKKECLKKKFDYNNVMAIICGIKDDSNKRKANTMIEDYIKKGGK